MGVQGLAQAPTEWYGRDRRFGMGRRECKYLPLHIQARSAPALGASPNTRRCTSVRGESGTDAFAHVFQNMSLCACL